ATVAPTNATNKNVTWSSTNSSVASVSGGVVTANAAGSATITVTTVDGSFTATCSVSVTAPEKTLSSISATGYKASFEVGESFSFGGTVTATYSDSSTSDVTSSASFGGYNMNATGTQTVTVSYTYGSTTKTTSYQITVTSQGGGSTGSGTYTIGWGSATGEAGTYSNFTTTSGSAAGFLSFTTAQNNGTNPPAYNSSSKELRLYYASNGNGCSITITPLAGIVYTGFTITATSGNTPTVKYSVNGGSSLSTGPSGTTYTVSDLNITSSLTIQNGNTSNTQLRIKTIELTYGVEDTSDKIVQSLSASYSGGNVYVGGSLDDSKVNVTAQYTDSVKYPSEALASSDYALSGFSSATAGNKIVTVTYAGDLETASSPLTTTFSVNVIADTVVDVTVSNTTTYHPGETIAKGDITVTLHYQSGATSTTSDFTFASDGYVFTYADTNSGASSKAKQFSITYGGDSYNFSVDVSRVAYEVISGSTTTLSSSQFSSSDVSKSINTPSETSVTIGGVGFTVDTNAYIYTLSSISYLSFAKIAGSIKNTEAFSSDLTSVSFTEKSGSRQDGVITISKDGTNWVAYSTDEVAKGGYRFFKIEYSGSSSLYSNISSISFTLSGQDNAVNVANYVMFEDTTNQCTTKLDLAIDKLNSMSEADKSTFWTSSDYVIATARERLLAWAAHEGAELTYSGGEFQINTSNLLVFNPLIKGTADSILIIVIGMSLLSVAGVVGFKFWRRRREN
ncbi:MAG: Ig-like domain-containing protein, partial [Bacilli bacterium]